MFHKLHIQMTMFCTIVTGSIFFALVFVCMFLAANSLKANNYASFTRQLNSALIHLKEQNTISHQWLNQLQKNEQFLLYLYDNNIPLCYQSYHSTRQEEILKEEAVYTARVKHGIDIFSGNPGNITKHTEFNFTSSNGQDYYASAGIIPVKNGYLSFIVLFPLARQHIQEFKLCFAVYITGLAAALLLFIFSWFFTKRMIIPLENTRQRQADFIASASHELRSPLAVIKTGLEIIRKTDTSSETGHFIDLMAGETNRMQNLVSNMLFLANADSGHLPLHKEKCQPDGLLIYIYEKYSPLARKKQLSLSLNLTEEIFPCCYCDKEWIQQVFCILLDNALSYTPSGGKIHIGLKQQKSFLVFSFADTGRGIPDNEKTLVFGRFYRSDNAHSDKTHPGLGLCLAKEIISAHNGRIWVEDVKGGGSCFYVELPVYKCNG